MRQEAEENLYMFGNGLAQLVWGTSALVRSLVNILASVAMTVTLFLSRSGNKVIDNPAWILIVFFMKWCKDTVWFNRVFMFFGKELYMNPEKAKDVRIYNQNTIAAKVLDKLIQHDRENQTALFKMSIFPAMANIIIGLANTVCYLFVAVKAFFGAFGASCSMSQFCHGLATDYRN